MSRIVIPEVTTIDFETEAIERRPKYPPKPVGVSIKEPGWSRPRYFAWGHPTKNNCSYTDAKRFLRKAWTGEYPLLFHHGKFDVAVGEQHMAMPRLDWRQYHDTMYLGFLNNPDSRTLALKMLAMEELRMSPKEQEDLRGWILAHVPEAKAKPKHWGAYICRAPGDKVGAYGIGDDVRTLRLFHHFYPKIINRGMGEAYDRERKLMHILMDTEKYGLRVHHEKLARDTKRYGKYLEEVIDPMIRKMLRASSDLDIDSNKQLADALEDSEKITEWILTKKGNRSTAKKALLESLDDKRLLAVLLYRGALCTYLRTFMRPWLEMADATGGTIHTEWNQVRQAGKGDGGIGARTGRLSSSPNFQNMPHPDRLAEIYERLKKARIQLWPLPLVRSYIAPDSKDHVLNVRDYSQQEVRLLAHFEDDALCAAYNRDPKMDMHGFAQKLINTALHASYSRKPIKAIGLGLIYGMGIGKLAASIDTDVDTAALLKKTYMQQIPGLNDLSKAIKQRVREERPIRTWGGREYFCEPPVLEDGKIRKFDYKLLNRLIQGSAADQTKEAIIRYDDALRANNIKPDEARFAITVHDESVAAALRRLQKKTMALLKEAMEDIKGFQVPMLSDGKVGMKDWANLKDYKD